MKLEKAIEELKNMTDGYTFKDCFMCLEYDENGCKCEYVKAINTVLKEFDNRIPKEKIANTLRRVQDYDLTYKDIALFNIINQELLGNEKWVDKE